MQKYRFDVIKTKNDGIYYKYNINPYSRIEVGKLDHNVYIRCLSDTINRLSFKERVKIAFKTLFKLSEGEEVVSRLTYKETSNLSDLLNEISYQRL
jgi:hypothetical protein